MIAIHSFRFPGFNRLIFILFIFISLLSTVSCSKVDLTRPFAERGIWHTVQPNETLESISRKYSVSLLELQQLNDIYDPGDITAGMQIFVPGVEQIQPQQPVSQSPVTQVTRKFIWPAKGTISSGYGIRHGRMHEGIDITRDGNKEIRAVAAGTVIFAGRKNGYGNTVLISHGNGLTTLYAHNAKLYVRKGTRVKQGLIIAKMGSSGNSKGIHLHFEVRLRNKHQNPLRFLPVR